MANHASILSYFSDAGLIVKCVMLILLASSVFSWTLIIQRAWFFKQKKQQYEHFAKRFWESPDLSQLFAKIDNNIEERHGLAAIFHAGFKEFLRMRQYGADIFE